MEKTNLYARALLPVLLTASLALSGCNKHSSSDDMLYAFGLLAATSDATEEAMDLCDNFAGILCSSFEDGTLEEWSTIGAYFDCVN